MDTAYLKNSNDLKKLLKAQLYRWMNTLKEKLPDYLEKFIISEYYDKPSPDKHNRQLRILSAIMSSNIKDIGDGYEFEIYLDLDKLSYDPAFWVSHGITYHMQEDNADTVFHNMSKAMNASADSAVTSGQFWKTFLNEIGEGGIYDIFADFKKYFGAQCGLTIH